MELRCLCQKDLEFTFLFSFWISSEITESQNGQGWQGPLWVIQSNPPAQAGSPRAGCTGPRPGGSWISPEKETPQPSWAACSRAPSPSAKTFRETKPWSKKEAPGLVITGRHKADDRNIWQILTVEGADGCTSAGVCAGSHAAPSA